MQSRPVASVIGLLLVLMAGAPLGAHHYFASTFDVARDVHLQGVVTRVEWSNPHMHFFLDVKADSGQAASWACEAGGPNSMLRRGLRREDLGVGATVTVDGYASRDGSRSLVVRRMTLASGRVVSGALSGDPGAR